MRIHSKLMLAALTCALVLTAFAGSASAHRSLSANPAGTITATAPVTFTSGTRRVLSLVTLRGSLHRTISKALRSLAGYITDCRTSRGREQETGFNINIRCDLTLPWHVQYRGIVGTLPRIDSILLEVLNVLFRLEDADFGGFLFNCKYNGTVNASTNAAARVTNIIIEERRSIPTADPDCRGGEEREGTLTGSFLISPTQTVTLI